MNKEIENLIKMTAEAGSINILSTTQIRDWLFEYLNMYEEEVGKFPELEGRPHADVLMADYDRSRPSLFIVAKYAHGSVTLASGSGDSSAVRNFLEREFPADANQIIPELASRFYVSEKMINVGENEIRNWLHGSGC
jgi:hypothetical protein